MHFRQLLALTSVGAAVAACAVPSGPKLPPAPEARCEDVISEGMAEREADAKRIAKEGVDQQLADARGNLLAAGLKRVRGVSYQTRCRPDALGLGLKTCTATARLCGR